MTRLQTRALQLSHSSLNVNTGNRANTDEIVHITEQTLHTVRHTVLELTNHQETRH